MKFYLDDSHVIALIMETKSRYFMEKFVTSRELNVIRNKILRKCIHNDLNVYDNDDIDRDYFMVCDGVILLKQGISLSSIVDYFQVCCPSIDIFYAIWDFEFVYQALVELRIEEYKDLKNDATIENVKISLVKIGYLVSMLDKLNLDKDIEMELLKTWYDGLAQCKMNGFSDNLIDVSDKPKLFSYLERCGFISDSEGKIIDKIKVKTKNI